MIYLDTSAMVKLVAAQRIANSIDTLLLTADIVATARTTAAVHHDRISAFCVYDVRLLLAAEAKELPVTAPGADPNSRCPPIGGQAVSPNRWTNAPSTAPMVCPMSEMRWSAILISTANELRKQTKGEPK